MEIHYSKASASKVSKLRFQEEKTKAITNGISQNVFREYVLSVEPEYNSPHGWDRIKTVWIGRCADIRLTELLSEMNNQLSSK